ncbi:MAG: MerR family transcriptional regulator [Polyangia bacterium]
MTNKTTNTTPGAATPRAVTPETVTPETATPETATPEIDRAEGKLLRIGQLAERCGKTVRALHLYEEMGLLKPVLRTPGGFRLYSAGAVERVQWIARLQEADVSLGEIQTLLRDLEEQRIGADAMTRLRELLARKLSEIREQRARLEQLERDITAGLHYLDGCRVCGPEHTTRECGGCRLHGHDGNQPLMVSGAHNS